MQIGLELYLIFFFAAFIRSGLGFGDALFAMPLLSLTVGLTLGTPVLAVDALIISFVLIIIERKQLKLKLLFPFLIGAFFGVPVGIYFLIYLPKQILMIVLGIIIILFSIYKLTNKKLQIKFPNYISPLIGFISGMLGGAYNTNGPPAIIYAAESFDTAQFKANLQGMLLPVNIIIISGHFMAGLWQEKTFTLFYHSLIPIFIGIVLGVFISKKISNTKINRFIWFALIVISLNLIINSL